MHTVMMNSINNVSVLVLASFFVATTFGYQNNFYDINYGLTGFTPYIPTQQLFRQYFHPLVMPYDEFGPLYYPPKCMFEHKEEEENSLIESRESIDGHNDNYYVSEENARGFSSLLKNFMISRKRTYSDKCSGGIQAWHQNFGLYRRSRIGTKFRTNMNDVCCIEVLGNCCVTIYDKPNFEGNLHFLNPGYVGMPFISTIKSVAVSQCDKLRSLSDLVL